VDPRRDVILTGIGGQGIQLCAKVLATHPAVAQVAVVGLPDASWGELVCAAIVVNPGAALPTVDELRSHVASKLVGPKQPRVVVEVDAIPRTDATGQIRRRRVRDAIVADGLVS
jgi:fatty-acyl-CoA synthase